MARQGALRAGRVLIAAMLVLAGGAIFGGVAEVDQLRYGDRPPAWVLGDFVGGQAR